MDAHSILLIIASILNLSYADKDVAAFELDLPSFIKMFTAANRAIEHSDILELMGGKEVAQNLLQKEKENADNNQGESNATRKALWMFNLRSFLPKNGQDRQAHRRSLYNGRMKMLRQLSSKRKKEDRARHALRAINPRVVVT